jgi:ADP-ribose pyrophosphatase
MQPWKTLERSLILNHSKYLQVERHTVELPDGQTISDWPWLIMPDYVNILVVTEEGTFLCFRQPKYGAGGITLALAGGLIELGEEPLVAAQRELLEETGYEAPQWISLGGYAVDGNRGAGTCYLFLALGARLVAEVTADDLEEQQLLYLSRAELEQALLAQKFKVLSWTSAVALGLLYLRKQDEV